MRGRIWIFAALVSAALALHLAVLSVKVAQNSEDTIRAHVALSTSALRSQLELLDARLSPRAVAAVPELIEATRPPADPSEAMTRPDERARLGRWAAAPAPGYGVLQIWLPGLENRLSGKLPRGATRYAVRGALLPIDSGVTAALTVPAAPYLAWLGRYQAFYLAALALFLLFSLIWGLAAPVPKVIVAPQEELPALPAAARSAAPGLDVGEARSTPPSTEDVPWAAAEILGHHAGEPKVVSRAAESLDP